MSYRTLISATDLSDHLDDDKWVIVDCRFSLEDTDRGRREYVASHIRGAVYAHLDDDLSGPVVSGETGRHPLPSPVRMAETFGAWGICDGIQVVAYDDVGGGIAARLWWMLHYLGHDDAAVLDGGWLAWLDQDRPTESGASTPSPRSFTPDVRKAWTVSAEDVNAVRHDPMWKVLDARAPYRFLGDIEPIDPVAGHIPGAVSSPYMENLSESGRFKTAEHLRDRFKNVIDATQPDHVVSYCGSGVTACHNVLAMEHAGLPGTRLYPGSWSEWITNPDRDVE